MLPYSLYNSNSVRKFLFCPRNPSLKDPIVDLIRHGRNNFDDGCDPKYKTYLVNDKSISNNIKVHKMPLHKGKQQSLFVKSMKVSVVPHTTGFLKINLAVKE